MPLDPRGPRPSAPTGRGIHCIDGSLAPLLVALVNGLAPLVFSLLILVPLWLASLGVPLPISPLYGAILVALVLLFLLGVFLGRITDISWLRSGLQTLLVAVVTAALIYLLTGH